MVKNWVMTHRFNFFKKNIIFYLIIYKKIKVFTNLINEKKNYDVLYKK
jgi:hypothetical protein